MPVAAVYLNIMGQWLYLYLKHQCSCHTVCLQDLVVVHEYINGKLGPINTREYVH